MEMASTAGSCRSTGSAPVIGDPSPSSEVTSASQVSPYSLGVFIRWVRLAEKTMAAVRAATPMTAAVIVERTGTADRPRVRARAKPIPVAADTGAPSRWMAAILGERRRSTLLNRFSGAASRAVRQVGHSPHAITAIKVAAMPNRTVAASRWKPG